MSLYFSEERKKKTTKKQKQQTPGIFFPVTFERYPHRSNVRQGS